MKAFSELSRSGQKRHHIEEACPPPSTLADETRWSENIKKLKCSVKCHRRPPELCHGLHVSLQVKAFATFMDDMKDESEVVDPKYIDIAMKLMFKQCEIRSESLIQKQWTEKI